MFAVGLRPPSNTAGNWDGQKGISGRLRLQVKTRVGAKKLQAQGHVRRKLVAAPWPVWAWAGSTTESASGFRIKGNTNLTGAVISSAADASQNSLTTGTLTYSDVQNHSHYDATSNGISAGVGVGTTGKAVGPGSVSGTGGISPMMSQNDSGDQSSTTRSAVSAGSINITNQAAQTQDVAGLSRDTTNTNGTVSATPDVNNLLSQQADTMQAAQAAGQVVAQGIGAYATMKEQQAQAAGDTVTADAWDEGGTDRVLAHIAGGALIGGLGGGGFGTAAQGAGVAAVLGGKLNSVADSIGSETGSMTLGNTVSNALAGLSGALVGGSAGAFTASNADLYNRDTTNANGTGGTGSQVLDWIGGQLASAGRGAVNMADQFAALVKANGPQGSYVNPDDLSGPGGNSKPPAAGGAAVPVAVCVPPICAEAVVPTPGTPGYVPDNATLANNGQSPNANDGNNTMLGADGAQFPSKTIWKGDGKERIDVENPNPGQRPGQIHYQDNLGNKYLYDPSTNSFPDAPNSVNKLLNDQSFNAAIQKGLNKYLVGR